MRYTCLTWPGHVLHHAGAHRLRHIERVENRAEPCQGALWRASTAEASPEAALLRPARHARAEQRHQAPPHHQVRLNLICISTMQLVVLPAASSMIRDAAHESAGKCVLQVRWRGRHAASLGLCCFSHGGPLRRLEHHGALGFCQLPLKVDK